MTTAQESPNAHRVLPPPFPVENPSEANSNDFPTDKANITDDATSVVILSDEPERGISPDPSQRQVAPLNSQISDLQSPDIAPAFTPNAYHFPPKRYAPKASPYQYDDFASGQTDATPLPGRCQFMFSDGRQCTMARSDIHPSLCRYHSEREEQLFGDPVSGGRVVGAACDLPELFSACRDLTTATGVNRALAQVFRLLAQRRISRQEATTFAKLGHLLLQSISAARAEFVAAPEAQMSHRAEQPGNRVVERGISRDFSPAGPLPDLPSQSANGRAVGTPAPAAAANSSVQPNHSPAPCEMPTTQAAPLPASNDRHLSGPNPDVRNSRKISTSEFAALKPVHNQHLQNNANKVRAELG